MPRTSATTSKTVFEIKKNDTNPVTVSINVYNELQSERKQIYQGTIPLGLEDTLLPLPEQYRMMISSEGALKINKCDDNNDLVFKLNNQDIEFYDEIKCAGSMNIQSANNCNIIGALKLQGSMNLESKKFHLTNRQNTVGLLQTEFLTAKTQSFTNRGVISCRDQNNRFTDNPITIKTESLDNRGGYIESASAVLKAKVLDNQHGTININKKLDLFLTNSLKNDHGNISSVSSSIDFHDTNSSLNLINNGTISTHSGCTINSERFTNNGRMINTYGTISFKVKHLALNSDGGNGGGVCSDVIETANLFSFQHGDNALYARSLCNLNILHSQKLNHVISMRGAINITCHGGKISNHSIIQSESGIQILTAFEWGPDYSIENFGGIIATNGSVVLQGKGVLSTTNGHGIYAPKGKVIPNCTNVNLAGVTHGHCIETYASQVYATALNARKNISIQSSQTTLNGYAIAGEDIEIKAGNTIGILGLLQSGGASNLSADNSITTGPNARIRARSAQLTSHDVYLNGRTEVDRRLEIQAANAVSIKGETFSAEDILIKTKTFLPQAPIQANSIHLDVDSIADVKAEVIAKKIISSKETQMASCELVFEGDKMVLRYVKTLQTLPSPEELQKQQRQIEKCIREQEEEKRKQRKKLQRKMLIKVGLSTVAGVGLSAVLGPQMVLVFGKMGMSTALAQLGGIIGEGMISSGINAAITGNRVLPNAVKGGALSLFGPARGVANFAYETARGRTPSVKTFIAEQAGAAIGSAISASAPIQNLNSVGRQLTKSVIEEGTTAALIQQRGSLRDRVTTVVAQTAGAATNSAITHIRQTIETKNSSSSTTQNSTNTVKPESKLPQPNSPKQNPAKIEAKESKPTEQKLPQQSLYSPELSNNPEFRRFCDEDKPQPPKVPRAQTSFNVPDIGTPRNPPQLGYDPRHFNEAASQLISHKLGHIPALVTEGVNAVIHTIDRMNDEHRTQASQQETKVCRAIGSAVHAGTTFLASKQALKATPYANTTPGKLLMFGSLIASSALGEKAGDVAELACHETVRAVEAFGEPLSHWSTRSTP